MDLHLHVNIFHYLCWTQWLLFQVSGVPGQAMLDHLECGPLSNVSNHQAKSVLCDRDGILNYEQKYLIEEVLISCQSDAVELDAENGLANKTPIFIILMEHIGLIQEERKAQLASSGPLQSPLITKSPDNRRPNGTIPKRNNRTVTDRHLTEEKQPKILHRPMQMNLPKIQEISADETQQMSSILAKELVDQLQSVSVFLLVIIIRDPFQITLQIIEWHSSPLNNLINATALQETVNKAKHLSGDFAGNFFASLEQLTLDLCDLLKAEASTARWEALTFLWILLVILVATVVIIIAIHSVYLRRHRKENGQTEDQEDPSLFDDNVYRFSDSSLVKTNHHRNFLGVSHHNLLATNEIIFITATPSLRSAASTTHLIEEEMPLH